MFRSLRLFANLLGFLVCLAVMPRPASRQRHRRSANLIRL